MISLPFPDRAYAARKLGAALARYRGQQPLVLAIPRGGVPVGRIVADMLGGELDVVLVRKLGAPSNPELAIGAVDEQGEVLLNANAGWVGADDAYVRNEATDQMMLIRERRQRYSNGRPPISAAGRTAIVVDDGFATGATMIAALRTVRAQRPARLICAVPVAARDSVAQVALHADDIVCLATPSPFHAVGLYYRDFSPVEDDEVTLLLNAAREDAAGAVQAQRTVRISTEETVLDGDLSMPSAPRGLVLFAHGSGSSRHSPRNRIVAEALLRHGIATLLFDLLTREEDANPQARFDIPLLTRRLDGTLQWARREPALKALAIGVFGASTGAAAALSVAAARPGWVAAVVSRGGRPDLAGAVTLSQVRTPTLLIVGGEDRGVLELNRNARALMKGWAELAIVPGATHLFEEPGTLSTAAEHAADWFARAFGNPNVPKNHVGARQAG